MKTEIVSFPEGNIAIMHEVASRRNATFQNVLIDEQYVLVGLGDSESVEDHVGVDWDPFTGSDNTYAENVVVFLPHEHANVAKERVTGLIQKVRELTDTYSDHVESYTCFAFRTTKSGLWFFFSDDCNHDDRLYHSVSELFNDLNPVYLCNYNMGEDRDVVCNNTTLYSTATPEESGGLDFIDSLAREQNPIVQLMHAEGIIDAEVQFEVSEDDDD